MGELEQRALGIFVQSPEIYVSLWAQSGETGLTEQQFQDLIDMGEEGRTQLLQQNKEFSKGIVEFYKNNQEVVDKALEQTTSKMFNGGKLAYGLEKFSKGGIFKFQNGGYNRAAAYYQNHANEGIIRKLQNFLYSRGYDLGDAGIDGRFGQKTYEAIRAYQRANGLKDDGMWGEDTNTIHRVLGAGDTTFNGSRSGMHRGTNTYTSGYRNTSYTPRTKVSMSDLNKAYERAITNPEWFWSDAEDATAWRQLFHQNANGDRGAIIRDIYANTPEEIRQRIDNKKLSNELQGAVYEAGINQARNEAAPAIASVLAAPLAIANPIATVGAVAGGYLGGKAGNQIGSDMSRIVINPDGSRGWKNQSGTTGDITGAQIATVRPDRSAQGEALGTAIGSVLGGMAGEGVSNMDFSYDPNYNASGIKLEINPGERVVSKKGTGNKRGKYTRRKAGYKPTPPTQNPDGTYANSKSAGRYVFENVSSPATEYTTLNSVNKSLKGGGRLVRRGYIGMQMDEPENVQRGTEPAYSISTRPKSAADEYLGYTSVWDNGTISHARNYFDGTTLRQDLIRSGWNGTPRRVSRVISNYGMPQADTVYVDANGKEGRRTQTAWQRFWGTPVIHSKQFMDGIDSALTKMVPAEINEKEVKARK